MDADGRMSYTVRIDGFHPARLNELLTMHWAKAQRRKQADYQVLLVAMQNGKVPNATGPRSLHLTWVMGPRNKVKPDPDGLAKSLLDGLVRTGRLVDDNPAMLTFLPVTYQRAKEKGIVLTLTDL